MSRALRPRTALTVAAATVALLSAACGSGHSASSPGAGSGTAANTANLATGGTLTELITSDPGNLDPAMTINSATVGTDAYLYDPVVYLSPSGSVVSGLASKWSQTGNTYTFTMRSGVTCSDGSAMTAATVAANLSYIANPANKSPLLGLFLPPGTKATASGSTVTVTVASAVPFFLQDMSNIPMVCQKGLTNRSLLAHGSDGTGPFVLSSAVPSEQYVLTKRSGYAWGPGGASTDVAGMPGKVILKVVSNETTEANLLLEKQANIANVLGPDRKRLAAAGLFSISAASPLGELWFNQAAGHPGQSEAVRQALTMALNLSQVGQVLSQGLGGPATGLVTLTPAPCSGNTVAGNVPAYNAATAASLLTQAGWVPGPGGLRTKDGKTLTVNLLYATDIGGDPADAFQLASQEWQKLGVKVQLTGNTSTGVETALFQTGSWDAVDIPLNITQPNDAVPFLSGPVPPQGNDFAHINDQAYSALSAAASPKPGSTGCPQWNQAEAAAFKDADVIPFENATAPWWGSAVNFQLVEGDIVPTSLRLHKS